MRVTLTAFFSLRANGVCAVEADVRRAKGTCAVQADRERAGEARRCWAGRLLVPLVVQSCRVPDTSEFECQKDELISVD